MMNTRRLHLESLEERTLLAVIAGGIESTAVPAAPTEAETWLVTTTEDTTGGDEVSLRDALDQAKSGDTIRFSQELSGKTITLSGWSLTVQKGVTVDASDLPGGITIDANGSCRAFYVSGGTESEPAVLKGLTITGGEIANDGGGIYNSGTLTIADCTVTGNNSSLSNSLGGGICNRGTLTITNCTVTGNNSNGHGGGIFNSGTLTITDTAVTENQNGGIYHNRGTLTVTDSIIAKNSASSGGGIYHSSGTLTVTGSTVAENTANYGGGIFTLFLSSSDINIYNSVIARNTAVNDGNDVYKNNLSGIVCARNTLSSYTEWTESESCLEYDPDRPLFTDAADGDFTLAEGSQAINAGNNDYVTTETDLAGNPRIAGGIVDLGAYEYQGGGTEQLETPTITTGDKGVYVSYGANRHRIVWTAVENASGYELQYSADGSRWMTVSTTDTAAVATGLTYGQDVKYRVRALGTGSYTDSDWSAVKMFNVCPMDINNDDDISSGDRQLLSTAWLSGEGEDEYRYYADINGDGDISGGDRSFLSNNWLGSAGDDDLVYPKALAAGAVFAEFASADPGINLDVF